MPKLGAHCLFAVLQLVHYPVLLPTCWLLVNGLSNPSFVADAAQEAHIFQHRPIAFCCLHRGSFTFLDSTSSPPFSNSQLHAYNPLQRFDFFFFNLGQIISYAKNWWVLDTFLVFWFIYTFKNCHNIFTLAFSSSWDYTIPTDSNCVRLLFKSLLKYDCRITKQFIGHFSLLLSKFNFYIQ